LAEPVSRVGPAAQDACAQPRPTEAISSPGLILAEHTPHVVGYLAVSGTGPA
jgi:hypothetical protein